MTVSRIGERGRTLATAVGFLTATEDEMLTEGQGATMDRERAAIHQFGAGLG